VQYNFYISDQRWGRMFVRISPYLPFSARVCLNQHHWLANRMRTEGVDFKQCSNAFLRCSHPQKLQELADSLTAHDLLSRGQKWLACLTPFFKESERKEAGCQHRLFFSQVGSLSLRHPGKRGSCAPATFASVTAELDPVSPRRSRSRQLKRVANMKGNSRPLH
jgi:hypothetical protein